MTHIFVTQKMSAPSTILGTGRDRRRAVLNTTVLVGGAREQTHEKMNDYNSKSSGKREPEYGGSEPYGPSLRGPSGNAITLSDKLLLICVPTVKHYLGKV